MNTRRLGRGHRWFLLVAFVSLLEVLAGIAQAQIVPITIVSVGDSYASGEGAPDVPVPGAPPRWRGDNRDFQAVNCHRSNNAAPVLAAKVVSSMRPASFFHLACSGAVIADLTTPKTGQLAIASGLVKGPIDALVISVGGNDVDFAAVVESCLALPCNLFGPAAFPGAVFALAPRLRALVAAVGALPGPVRHVFVTEYPDTSTTPYPGLGHRCGSPFPPGTPNIPGSGFDGLDFSKADTAAATVINPLNSTLALAVSTASAVTPGGPIWHFVTGISAAFDTHGYCMGLPNPAPQMWVTGRMINTFADSERIQGDERGTMHPNASGDAAASAAIATAILANVPIVTMPGTPPPPPPTSPCVSHDTIACPGYCGRHPTDARCQRGDECLNRHLPGCSKE